MSDKSLEARATGVEEWRERGRVMEPEERGSLEPPWRQSRHHHLHLTDGVIELREVRQLA